MKKNIKATNKIKKAVILGGGMGTRLSSITKNIPKLLVKIGNKPVIEHQIILLKNYGIKEIWMLLGYLGDQIREYLGDGKKFGVKIYYHQETMPMGTAGALKVLSNKFREEFLLLSGDIMLNFDIKKFINWHRRNNRKKNSIVVHPSDHPLDSDLVEVNKTWRVTSLLIRPRHSNFYFRNLSIASVFIFSPQIFRYIPKNKKCDIEKDILPLMLKSNAKIYAYNTPEYFKDIGTPRRLKEARKDYASGKTKNSFKNKMRAIFIDRDGVINREVDQLFKIRDFKIYDFVARAIKKINNSDYLAIVVTNQPMIAKGFMSENDLEEIHKKLDTELGRNGAKIDAIYYCPHYPESGFSGEVLKLKIKCDCRKPNIGLIKKAALDFNLDLNKSFFIGDSSVDAKTAENARINFIGVKTGYACRDNRYWARNKFPLYKNLLVAVDNII